MTAAPGDFVKVTYNGRQKPVRDRTGTVLDTIDDDAPLVLRWDSRSYPIPIGETVFVPFDAMTQALGDPRSSESMQSVKNESGNVEFVLDRATEVRRLRTLYDNQLGDETVIMYAPDADVYDLEDNPIRTVVQDPQGESVTPVVTTINDRDALLAQVQRQQRMIEMLAEQQGIDLANLNSDANIDAEGGQDEFATTTALPEDK